jgi:hypothetical protein
MKPKHEISLKEGFRNLRRRLPSLDRAYRRQRLVGWLLRILLIVGVAGIAWAAGALSGSARRWAAPVLSPVSARSGVPADNGMKSSRGGTQVEGAPDAIAHVELSDHGSHR